MTVTLESMMIAEAKVTSAVMVMSAPYPIEAFSSANEPALTGFHRTGVGDALGIDETVGPGVGLEVVGSNVVGSGDGTKDVVGCDDVGIAVGGSVSVGDGVGKLVGVWYVSVMYGVAHASPQKEVQKPDSGLELALYMYANMVHSPSPSRS